MAPLDVPSAHKNDLTGAVAAPVIAVPTTPGRSATDAWAFADKAAVKAKATRAKRIACEVFILLRSSSGGGVSGAATCAFMLIAFFHTFNLVVYHHPPRIRHAQAKVAVTADNPDGNFRGESLYNLGDLFLSFLFFGAKGRGNGPSTGFFRFRRARMARSMISRSSDRTASSELPQHPATTTTTNTTTRSEGERTMMRKSGGVKKQQVAACLALALGLGLLAAPVQASTRSLQQDLLYAVDPVTGAPASQSVPFTSWPAAPPASYADLIAAEASTFVNTFPNLLSTEFSNLVDVGSLPSFLGVNLGSLATTAQTAVAGSATSALTSANLFGLPTTGKK